MPYQWSSCSSFICIGGHSTRPQFRSWKETATYSTQLVTHSQSINSLMKQPASRRSRNSWKHTSTPSIEELMKWKSSTITMETSTSLLSMRSRSNWLRNKTRSWNRLTRIQAGCWKSRINWRRWKMSWNIFLRPLSHSTPSSTSGP